MKDELNIFKVLICESHHFSFTTPCFFEARPIVSTLLLSFNISLEYIYCLSCNQNVYICLEPTFRNDLRMEEQSTTDRKYHLFLLDSFFRGQNLHGNKGSENCCGFFFCFDLFCFVFHNILTECTESLYSKGEPDFKGCLYQPCLKGLLRHNRMKTFLLGKYGCARKEGVSVVSSIYDWDSKSTGSAFSLLYHTDTAIQISFTVQRWGRARICWKDKLLQVCSLQSDQHFIFF